MQKRSEIFCPRVYISSNSMAQFRAIFKFTVSLEATSYGAVVGDNTALENFASTFRNTRGDLRYTILRDDGVEILNDTTKYEITSDHLLILNVTPEDAGRYEWTITRQYASGGTQVVSTKSDNLYVLGESICYMFNT